MLGVGRTASLSSKLSLVGWIMVVCVICNHTTVLRNLFVLPSPWPTTTVNNSPWLTDVIVSHQVRAYTTMQNSPLMNDNPASTQSTITSNPSVFQQQQQRPKTNTTIPRLHHRLTHHAMAIGSSCTSTSAAVLRVPSAHICAQ